MAASQCTGTGGSVMSVLITSQFQGDTSKFRQSLTEQADQLTRFANMARSAGAVHHRFGVGNGFVVAVDEWDSLQQYEKFMENPELQDFISKMGAAPVPPQVTVTEAIDSPDEF